MSWERPLEILADTDVQLVGRRVIDFGFGTTDDLLPLVRAGAIVTGIELETPKVRPDVLPREPALLPTSVTLLRGHFPTQLRHEVGTDASLFLFKNVLKRGLLEHGLVQLGVPESEFLAAVGEALRPRGVVLSYNFRPAPPAAGAPPTPWADGRSPFRREHWEAFGFEVLAFDTDDTAGARAWAWRLRWHESEERLDIERDLFASYCLLRKR